MTQERRLAPRYPIDAAIAVNERTARTIDLSSNSVYFETATRLDPGEQVTLVIPFQHSATGASVKCSAHIVRVDLRGSLFGIAAIYQPVSFSVNV